MMNTNKHLRATLASCTLTVAVQFFPEVGPGPGALDCQNLCNLKREGTDLDVAGTRVMHGGEQAHFIAKIYATLNEKEQTLTWLERGLAMGAIGAFYIGSHLLDAVLCGVFL